MSLQAHYLEERCDRLLTPACEKSDLGANVFEKLPGLVVIAPVLDISIAGLLGYVRYNAMLVYLYMGVIVLRFRTCERGCLTSDFRILGSIDHQDNRQI
jgi:hypothetical protein